MPRSLVVKVTCAGDDPERANQAFTVAATAAGSGVRVSLWLTGEAARYGVVDPPTLIDLPHAVPVPELLAIVRELGTVTVCTQCAARRGITEGDLAPGVRLAGAAGFVAEVLEDDVQALVY